MTDLSEQFTAEHRTKQRQFVLAGIQARWRLIVVGVLLLGVVRLFHVVAVSWAFLIGFAVASVAANYAMTRLVRETAFRPGYVVLTLALGAAMISAVVYGLDRTGYLLYAVYLIAPLQAALPVAFEDFERPFHRGSGATVCAQERAHVRSGIDPGVPVASERAPAVAGSASGAHLCGPARKSSLRSGDRVLSE